MNKFVKSIPNMITGLRIIGSVAFLFLRPLSLEFYIVYGFCGLTDILDGFIARRLHIQSELGSMLDSFADIIFYIAMAIKIVPIALQYYTYVHWILVAVVISIHGAAYVICALKFKRFSAVHTYANKAMSALIFLIPYSFIGFIPLLYNLYFFIGSGIALYSALEMVLIHSISNEYDETNKTIFHLIIKRTKKDD